MNSYPTTRLRRLRETASLRRLTTETRLSVSDFVYPIFVTHGRGVRDPIASMPGQSRLSVDQLARVFERERMRLARGASSGREH